jgi:hypothetical protein
MGSVTLPSCATYAPHTVTIDKAAERIIASMPEDWTLVEHKQNVQLPAESYDQKHTGEKLTLLDHETHDYYWWDEDNVKHSEPLTRKRITLWIMPPETDPKYWLPSPWMEVPPKLILRAKEMKIYAELCFLVMDRDRVMEVSKGSKGFGSDEVKTVSWTNWEDAIRFSVSVTNDK